MSSGKAKPSLLHIHSEFGEGIAAARCVQLINAFGAKFEHSLVSADAVQSSAAQNIKRTAKVSMLTGFPALSGMPTPGRLQKLARAMQGYDLILTYGWGAMDTVMAHTLFGEVHGLPPLVHHEDGFCEDERARRKKRRNWYRKIAFGKASGLVVPNEALEEIALVEWEQPIGRVKRIDPGVDTKAYAKKAKADALPRLLKRPGEHWVGAMASDADSAHLAALVRAVAALPDNWHLVLVGDVSGRAEVMAEADAQQINHRVHLPGEVDEICKILSLFDIFADAAGGKRNDAASTTALVEAMAAGLPVAIASADSVLSQDNADFLAPFAYDETLADALAALAFDEGLRGMIGKANQKEAQAKYDATMMAKTYLRLYSSALDRSGR
ncbi:glycosyltransferase [Erythrobacter sp. W53]|uniref:glycosyltransferase n=1 Tax=Erythrobacter sp. W53 TaxID=3425947 RepID=UPI003D768C63